MDIARLRQLRGQIAELKAQEGSVRQRLLTLRDGVHLGPDNLRLKIETKRQRHLDRQALPDEVLSDPHHWTEREVRVLRFLDDLT